MKRYLKLVGFALLGIILWRVDISTFGEVLSSAQVGPLAAAFGVSLLSIFVKASRWRGMLAALDFSYRRHRATMVYLAGIYIGIATPGRLGELARVLYIKRDFKASAGLGLSSVVLDRIFDLYVLMAAGLIASFRFELAGSLSAVFLVGVVALLGAPLMLLNPRFGRWFTRRILARAMRKKFGQVLSEGADDFFAGLESMLSIRLVWWGLLTVAAYLLFFWSGYLIATSLGIEIGMVDAALTLGLANLLSLVPITVAGVGTRDAVFVFAFAFLALTPTHALAFSALVLLVFYIGGGAMGFACFLVDRPIVESKE